MFGSILRRRLTFIVVANVLAMAPKCAFSIERLQRIGVESMAAAEKKFKLKTGTLSCKYVGVLGANGEVDPMMAAKQRSKVQFEWHLTSDKTNKVYPVHGHIKHIAMRGVPCPADLDNLLTTQGIDDDKYLAICKHYGWDACGVMAHDDLHIYMHLPGRVGDKDWKKFTWLRPDHPTSPCLWITNCMANRSQPPTFVWRSLADVQAEVQQENTIAKENARLRRISYDERREAADMAQEDEVAKLHAIGVPYVARFVHRFRQFGAAPFSSTARLCAAVSENVRLKQTLEDEFWGVDKLPRSHLSQNDLHGLCCEIFSGPMSERRRATLELKAAHEDLEVNAGDLADHPYAGDFLDCFATLLRRRAQSFDQVKNQLHMQSEHFDCDFYTKAQKEFGMHGERHIHLATLIADGSQALLNDNVATRDRMRGQYEALSEMQAARDGYRVAKRKRLAEGGNAHEDLITDTSDSQDANDNVHFKKRKVSRNSDRGRFVSNWNRLDGPAFVGGTGSWD